MRLHLLFQPWTISPIATIFLPIIFVPMIGLWLRYDLLARLDRSVLNYLSAGFVSLLALFVPFAVGTKR